MSDLVVTVPQGRWKEWIAEGDLPDQAWDGTYEYSFYVSQAPDIRPGERVYIAALGKLRGYAPLVRVDRTPNGGYALVRRGGAVAVTIPKPIRGFRGCRARWWDRAAEVPFPDWRQP
jgi:hypothetical protein